MTEPIFMKFTLKVRKPYALYFCVIKCCAYIEEKIFRRSVSVKFKKI